MEGRGGGSRHPQMGTDKWGVEGGMVFKNPRQAAGRASPNFLSARRLQSTERGEGRYDDITPRLTSLAPSHDRALT